jgi:hypothetical protein
MMMRIINLLLLLVLLSVPNVADAQEHDEYVYKKVASRKGNTLRSESPVSTSSTLSKTETIYKIYTDLPLCDGDLITGITYKGYNPDEEITRHLTVWIRHDEIGRIWNFTSMDKMTKVFDGDCKILHGGTADEPEDILDIVFSTPVAYVNPYNISITIISEGEARDSVFFLHAKEDLAESLYATAGEDGQLCDPIKSSMPFVTFTIATPVRYVSGTVTDENGKGVAGATINLRSMEWEETSYKGNTNAEGKYQIRIEEGNKTYMPSVSAPGHTSYSEVWGFSVKDNPVRNFTIYGSVTYPANEQSSIILPVAPDATIGKYYKLVRREGKRFIFEHEPSPQANVPYVLFADRDYTVDLADMDLSITPGRIVLDSLSMVGSYSNDSHAYANYIDRDLDTNSTTGRAMHAHLYGHYSLLLYDDYTLVFDNSKHRCATPTIAYDKGRLVFSCETEGAECVYEIKCADEGSGRGSEVSLGQTYEIRVYATLDGYEDSDVATATISWRNGRPVMEGFSSITLDDGEGSGDVNGDGKVDVADIATIISIMAGTYE